ncbi:MAG: hypothetical protein ACREV1_17310, partial [Gammaproteobacteria bacterium]
HVVVTGVKSFHGQRHYVIRQADETLTYLPEWMVRAEAESHRGVESLRLPFSVLRELRGLLDVALSSLSINAEEGGNHDSTPGKTNGSVSQLRGDEREVLRGDRSGADESPWATDSNRTSSRRRGDQR